MRLRNPEEPTTYIQITGRNKAAKKVKGRGLTVYGVLPDRVAEIIENALNDAAKAEPQMRRRSAVPA